MKKVMLIINPKSGNETAPDLQPLVTDHLAKYFEEIETRITSYAGQETVFAQEAAEKKFHAIMIVGGDGTINRVMTGIVNYEQRPQLAIIPAGTGNLLAKVLGLPSNSRRAIQSYTFKKTKRIDLGMCNDRVFNLFASLGAIPDAIHDVSSEAKAKYGFLAYLVNSFGQLTKSQEVELKITTDDCSYSGKVDHFLISLTNHLGIWRFTELNHSISNGKASVFILKDKSFLKRALTVTSAISGKIENADALISCISSEITIDSLHEDKLYIDLDGEKGPKLPVNIKILQKHNEFYLPD